MKINKTITFILFKLFITMLLLFCNNLFAQLNSDLEKIGFTVSFDKDSSVAGFSNDFLKFVDYDFSFQNDTLQLTYIVHNYQKSDSLVKFSRKNSFKIPIKFLDEIKIKTSKLNTAFNCDTCTIIKHDLLLYSVRRQQLFTHIMVDQALTSSYASIPIFRAQDTIHFKELVKAIEKNFDFESNFIAASCEGDSIQITETGPIYYATKNVNLESPIQINGKNYTKDSLLEILKPLINEFELNSLAIYIILNTKHQYEIISIFEYDVFLELGKEYANADNEMKKMMQEVLGFITKEQNDKIIEVLKDQSWTAGKCVGKYVNSAIAFEYKKD